MKIQHDDETYCIADGEESGDRSDFGDAAMYESGGKLYAAFLEGPGEAREGCEPTVYRLERITTETEEVEFDDDEDDESDEGREDAA